MLCRAAFDAIATDAHNNLAVSVQTTCTEHAGGVDGPLAHLVAELAADECIDPPIP